MFIIRAIKRTILFICLFMLSLMANIAIKIVPFKKLMGFLTNHDKVHEYKLSEKQIWRLKRVLYYLEIIEKRVPWRVMCFEQAIITLLLCRLLKIDVGVIFGVKKNDQNKLAAHAWTFSGDILISGGVNAHEYTPVYERAYMTKK